jgi:hypothetical protein
LKVLTLQHQKLNKVFTSLTNCITLFLLLLCCYACDSANTPLDATTRERIDSLYIVGSNAARDEVDSICKKERELRFNALVDSIRNERLREIEAQLKSVRELQ